MGKGDRRSRRGKIFRGTFGKSRKHESPSAGIPVNTSAKTSSEPVATPAEAPKKKRVAKKKTE